MPQVGSAFPHCFLNFWWETSLTQQRKVLWHNLLEPMFLDVFRISANPLQSHLITGPKAGTIPNMLWSKLQDFDTTTSMSLVLSLWLKQAFIIYNIYHLNMLNAPSLQCSACAGTWLCTTVSELVECLWLLLAARRWSIHNPGSRITLQMDMRWYEKMSCSMLKNRWDHLIPDLETWHI